jgi:hypothetical protein
LLSQRVAKLSQEIANMPTLPRLHAVAAPTFIDRMQAAASNPLAIPKGLLRALHAVGIEAPGDESRLTEAQLEAALKDKDPGQRIALKTEIQAAGLYPKSIKRFSNIPQPW